MDMNKYSLIKKLSILSILIIFSASSISFAKENKGFHNDHYSRSVVISAPASDVWDIVKDPAGLPKWIPGIKETTITSNIKQGIGTVREIVLGDGLLIEEHFVGWKDGKSVSYIMVKGFPLRGYHATMSLNSLSEYATLFTWSVYYTTKEMGTEEFTEFSSNLRSFFEETLQNLKKMLEN